MSQAGQLALCVCIWLSVFGAVAQDKPEPRYLPPLANGSVPDDTLLSRNGKETGVDWTSCRLDPDIAAACFMVRGRISLWNGTPSLRIWRIGTNRILGLHTGTTPENVNDLWGRRFMGDRDLWRLQCLSLHEAEARSHADGLYRIGCAPRSKTTLSHMSVAAVAKVLARMSPHLLA